MTTTNNLRTLLDLKTWEPCTPAPVTNAAAMFLIPSRWGWSPQQYVLYVTSATVHYLYAPKEDAWAQIASGALGGTFGVGACGAWHPGGPTGTASAGTSTTITTTLTTVRGVTGCVIRITGGTGAGQERTISTNTIGANSVFTVSSAWSVTPDNTSTYQIMSGRFYVFNAGTLSATSFKYYDVITAAWSALSVTGLPASWGTDGKLVATFAKWGSTPGAGSLATGTATSATSTTLVNSGKSWATNQWASAQVRITSGTGAGQVRTISSNTGTTLTVSSSWTVTPDATSVYAIDPNDDYLYLLGNGAVTLYRYSISGNTWSTLSPGAARAGAPSAGFSAEFVDNESDPNWTNESSVINGRRIYSFRSGAASTLDYYDIAANTWVSGVTYAQAAETFTNGTSYVYTDDRVVMQKDATGRFFTYCPSSNSLEPFSTLQYAQGAATLGHKGFSVRYTDGATKLWWVYNLRNTGTELFRALVIGDGDGAA